MTQTSIPRVREGALRFTRPVLLTPSASFTPTLHS